VRTSSLMGSGTRSRPGWLRGPASRGTSGGVVRIDMLGPNQFDAPLGTIAVLSLAEVQVFVDGTAIPLTITQQPRSGRVYAGRPFRFSVGLLDATGVTFQWKKGATPVPGETGQTLTFCKTKPSDTGTYTVTATRTRRASRAIRRRSRWSMAIWPPPGGVPVFDGLWRGSLPRHRRQHGRRLREQLGHPHRGRRSGALVGGAAPRRQHHRDDHPVEPDGRLPARLPLRLEALKLPRLDPRWGPPGGPRRGLFHRRAGISRHEDGGLRDPRRPAVTGRYVRVDILGPNSFWGLNMYVSLAEVEVFGTGPTAPPDPDIARGRITTQSSTHPAPTPPAWPSTGTTTTSRTPSPTMLPQLGRWTSAT